MSDFETFEKIELKALDNGIEYTFDFPACTGEAANDGALPANTSLSSAIVSGYGEDGVADNTLIHTQATVLNNVVKVFLKYPDGGVGRYSLGFFLTDSNGYTYDFDFESVFAI